MFQYSFTIPNVDLFLLEQLIMRDTILVTKYSHLSSMNNSDVIVFMTQALTQNEHDVLLFIVNNYQSLIQNDTTLEQQSILRLQKKDAMIGSYGVPSATNPFVTTTDPRLTIATSTKDGLMSKEDKIRLENIAESGVSEAILSTALTLTNNTRNIIFSNILTLTPQNLINGLFKFTYKVLYTASRYERNLHFRALRNDNLLPGSDYVLRFSEYNNSINTILIHVMLTDFSMNDVFRIQASPIQCTLFVHRAYMLLEKM